MFGINNDKVEFSDIVIGYIQPAKDATGGSNASDVGSGGGGVFGIRAEDEEEDFTLGDDEDAFEIQSGENKSQICASKTTCLARDAWCKDIYKDDVPSDCVDNFPDYCCGTIATDNLEECKLMVNTDFTPTDPAETVS